LGSAVGCAFWKGGGSPRHYWVCDGGTFLSARGRGLWSLVLFHARTFRCRRCHPCADRKVSSTTDSRRRIILLIRRGRFSVAVRAPAVWRRVRSGRRVARQGRLATRPRSLAGVLRPRRGYAPLRRGHGVGRRGRRLRGKTVMVSPYGAQGVARLHLVPLRHRPGYGAPTGH
jgi:hypothetical protein